MLARELLKRPDSFITAKLSDEEYIIEGLKTVKSHANIDDSVMYITLNLSKICNGNIIM